jgi:hypothetical protein
MSLLTIPPPCWLRTSIGFALKRENAQLWALGKLRLLRVPRDAQKFGSSEPTSSTLDS